MTSNTIHHSCFKIERTSILPKTAYILNTSWTVAKHGGKTCSRAPPFFLNVKSVFFRHSINNIGFIWKLELFKDYLLSIQVPFFNFFIKI